jgi:hypothetical protein
MGRSNCITPAELTMLLREPNALGQACRRASTERSECSALLPPRLRSATYSARPVGMGLLRKVSALLAACVRRRGDPVGP